MSFDNILNGVELLLLAYLIIKSKGWDGPGLRSAVEALQRDYGFLRSKLNTIEQRTDSNKFEISNVKNEVNGLRADYNTLGAEVTKINHRKA